MTREHPPPAPEQDADRPAMLQFEDGRSVLYDPENPDAWLLTDAPVEL